MFSRFIYLHCSDALHGALSSRNLSFSQITISDNNFPSSMDLGNVYLPIHTFIIPYSFLCSDNLIYLTRFTRISFMYIRLCRFSAVLGWRKSKYRRWKLGREILDSNGWVWCHCVLLWVAWCLLCSNENTLKFSSFATVNRNFITRVGLRSVNFSLICKMFH